MVVAFIERATRTLRANAYEPSIMLTDGGASRILDALEEQPLHRPNLVLSGLAHMLENTQ